MNSQILPLFPSHFTILDDESILTLDLAREPCPLVNHLAWGVNVWSTDHLGNPVSFRRHWYDSAAQAKEARFTDQVGERGRVA